MKSRSSRATISVPRLPRTPDHATRAKRRTTPSGTARSLTLSRAPAQQKERAGKESDRSSIGRRWSLVREHAAAHAVDSGRVDRRGVLSLAVAVALVDDLAGRERGPADGRHVLAHRVADDRRRRGEDEEGTETRTGCCRCRRTETIWLPASGAAPQSARCSGGASTEIEHHQSGRGCRPDQGIPSLLVRNPGRRTPCLRPRARRSAR